MNEKEEKAYWYNRLDSLNIGDCSDPYINDLDQLIALVRELEEAREAGNLNLETDDGIKNLERIYTKHSEK